MFARRNREAWRSPVGINRKLRDRYPAQKRDRLQIDQVRRNEAQKLRAKGDTATLKHTHPKIHVKRLVFCLLMNECVAPRQGTVTLVVVPQELRLIDRKHD